MPFHTHISTPTGARIVPVAPHRNGGGSGVPARRRGIQTTVEPGTVAQTILRTGGHPAVTGPARRDPRGCHGPHNRGTALFDRPPRTPLHLAHPAMGGYRLAPHTARGNRHRAAGRRVERVAARVFNENELQAHTESPRSHTLWLHLCWSAKEALFKAMPEAGIDFRTQLHVAPPHTLDHEGLFTAVENRTSAHGRYTLWYAIHDEWVMVCATPLP